MEEEAIWPVHGPYFNAWNNDFGKFAALLDSVKDEPWWISDTALKYLNIRLDTRDNGWLLSIDDSEDRISPSRVVAAIEKYLTRFPSQRPHPHTTRRRAEQ